MTGGRASLWIAGCFSLATLAVAQPESPAHVPPRPVVDHPDVVFEGVRLWRFRGSALVGSGTAERSAYSRSAGLASAEEVQSQVKPSATGQSPSLIHAGEAVARVDGSVVDGFSGVTFARADGVMKTSSAHYEQKTHLIAGAEPVELSNDRMVATGSSFTLDTETERLELFAPVDAHTVPASHTESRP